MRGGAYTEPAGREVEWKRNRPEGNRPEVVPGRRKLLPVLSPASVPGRRGKDAAPAHD